MPVDNALHKAAHNGDLKKVQQLLDSGEIDVNSPGASQRRPLHRAAGANHLDVCKYLIANGATIDQTDKCGRTPLHWACISGHLASASFLIERNANIFATNLSQMIPLHMSAESGNADVVSILIQKADDRKGYMFVAKNKEGLTPYDLANQGNQKRVIKVLKSSGDPNSKGFCGCAIS